MDLVVLHNKRSSAGPASVLTVYAGNESFDKMDPSLEVDQRTSKQFNKK